MWVRNNCISGAVNKNGSGNRGRSCMANFYCVSVLSKISMMCLEIVALISVCLNILFDIKGEHLSE